MRWTESAKVGVIVGLLVACGSPTPNGAGEAPAAPASAPQSTTRPTSTSTTTAPPTTTGEAPAATDGGDETTVSSEVSTTQYGTADDGFVVAGAPVGLKPTEVPLNRTVGLQGETIVSQRFTADTLDSQVTITRTTSTDTQRLIDQFEEALSNPIAETSEVAVGDDEYPGYLYREEGLGWRGLMWVISDDSALWVIASGLTDDQILAIASGVEVA